MLYIQLYNHMHYMCNEYLNIYGEEYIRNIE